MARFIKGDVVVVPFPFSDLTDTKRRPALVITALEGNDVILSQITSQFVKDRYSFEIGDQDFQEAGLNKKSNVRPNRLFTADSFIIIKKVGSLKPPIMESIIFRIVQILQNGDLT
ncbi:MAG: type II toxin-antitoxin system PemK/MazF family toxin [Deltaproteobacteria bacterium]|nr:type II toxin-antitoxin system PemK/MazF family toxin [Deltaproteobacteria bacterium]